MQDRDVKALIAEGMKWVESVGQNVPVKAEPSQLITRCRQWDGLGDAQVEHLKALRTGYAEQVINNGDVSAARSALSDFYKDQGTVTSDQVSFKPEEAVSDDQKRVGLAKRSLQAGQARNSR